jgi:hypothetical protein
VEDVKTLSADILQTNVVKIVDIILPLPGSNVQIPTNGVCLTVGFMLKITCCTATQWYTTVLQNDGLSLDSFLNEKHNRLVVNAFFLHF